MENEPVARAAMGGMRAAALACAGLVWAATGCARGYDLSLGGERADAGRERTGSGCPMDAASCNDAAARGAEGGGSHGSKDGGSTGANDAAAREDDAATRSGDHADADSGSAACREDDDCSSPTPTCDRSQLRCIECRSDADCQETGKRTHCTQWRCRE